MQTPREYAETAASKPVSGRRGSIDGVREVFSLIPGRTLDLHQAAVLAVLLGLTLLLAAARVADAAGRTGDAVLNVESGHPESHHRTTADVRDSGEDWLTAAKNYIRRLEYHASESAAGMQAPNRRQGIRTYFEPTGIRIIDREADGNPQLLALRLKQTGRSNSFTSVAPGEVASDGSRVEIRRGSLLEWYVNSPSGLEQGFTLMERIKGKGPLVLDLALESAGASWSRESVRIATASGRQFNYGQLKAVDAAGVSLPVQLSAPNAGHIRIQVDDASAVYPVVIDPLLAATAETQIESDQRGALFGYSVAGAGDVNGDGYDDIIIGAWRYDAGQKDEGAAFIFHGSASGIADGTPSTANTRLESDQPGAEMGENVAGAGDINGDGYDDVIVGAWRYDAGETDEGAAFVFYGSATGIADGSPATARTRLEGDQAGALFGDNVGGAGDVNGDGYADVIVGASEYGGGGAAFVFHGGDSGIANGNPATAQTRLVTSQAGAMMGLSVDGAGDINGDGYADVIVGAARFDAGERDEGAAFVFLGSASGIADATPATASARLESDQAEALMGVSVAGAGDVNGDGYDDVIVGARYYDAGKTDEGVVFIFHGGAAGIADGTPDTAQTRLKGDQAGAWMGYLVDGAGDINGDGYADVIVGAGRYDTDATLTGWGRHLLTGKSDEGAAFLFLGSASGIADASPASAYAVFESDQLRDYLGTAVSGAGDVNGDGFDDVVVGAYQYDCGQKNEGAAFVILGGDLTASGSPGRDLGSLHNNCEPLPPAPLPKRLIAAALIILVTGAGLIIFLLRRRGRSSRSSS